jgi:hypothetical protein
VENANQVKMHAEAVGGESQVGETICRGYRWKMLSS